MEEINLNDFNVVVNENGVVLEDKTSVLLQNTTTGQVLKVLYSNVADFYGLDELSKPPPVAGAPQKWDQEQTKFLFQEYARWISYVGPFKKFRTKKLMWTHIATDIQSKFGIENLTATQVEGRYKCVKRRSKKQYNDYTRFCQTNSYNDDSVEQDGPMTIDKIFSQKSHSTKMDVSQETMETSPFSPDPFAPGPSSQMSASPSPSEMEDEDKGEVVSSRPQRNRKTPQVKILEAYLQQKADYYKKREEKFDEKAKFKAQKEKDKAAREQQKANLKQQRHIEKINLLKEMIAKASK